MKYLAFTIEEEPNRQRLGALVGDIVVDLAAARLWARTVLKLDIEEFPSALPLLIEAGPSAWNAVKQVMNTLQGEEVLARTARHQPRVVYSFEDIILLPPILRPRSLRDFYAFEQHVVTAYQNRNRTVPEEWYQFPVFYYSNPNSIYGPGEPVPYPPYSQALDYELEIACIIGKAGIDIQPDQAEEHIFGYTVFNDWSARDVQRSEVKVGLGPAKGKDFASSLGPWIVTPDELADARTDRCGVYDLHMTARINGETRSSGCWKDVYYSFGEMIARASQDVYLLPGEVIGSGTVGTGCLLELTRGEGPWLQPGDIVECEVERMGVLRNRVIGTPKPHLERFRTYHE